MINLSQLRFNDCPICNRKLVIRCDYEIDDHFFYLESKELYARISINNNHYRALFIDKNKKMIIGLINNIDQLFFEIDVKPDIRYFTDKEYLINKIDKIMLLK
jgi:hypothetical protein